LRQNTQFKRSDEPEDSGNLSSMNNTSSKLMRQHTTQKKNQVDPVKQKQQLTQER
jgi:hypothetical protein